MDLKPGMDIVFQTLAPVTQEQLNAYSEASGDFNQIHLKPEVAQAAGLPGVIAHGMLVASWICNRAVNWLNDLALKEAGKEAAAARIYFFQSRFKAMTLLGDSLSIGGSVKALSEGVATLELQAKNQRGELVVASIVKAKI